MSSPGSASKPEIVLNNYGGESRNSVILCGKGKPQNEGLVGNHQQRRMTIGEVAT